MNIKKWIEENMRHTYIDGLEVYGDECISIDDLEQLLKTHAIVPRELSDKIINKTPCSNIRAGVKRKIHKAMIKAAEND